MDMYFKQLFAPLVGLNPAGIWSAAKIRFARWYSESSYFTSSVGGIMEKSKTRKMQSLLLTFILMVAALWVSPAAVAADKKMVTDPSTGKMVTAPEYGGKLTIPRKEEGTNPDLMFTRWVGGIRGVLEKPTEANWGIDRAEFNFIGYAAPLFALEGALAESWSQPDPLTYIIKVRQGVHWHKKAPMNGRALTAQDIEFNYHRLLGNKLTGTEFSEAEPSAYTRVLVHVPFESITATDQGTVVFKLKAPKLGAMLAILDDYAAYIYPPEVIKEHGDATDWRNLVGTGPFMLTDLVEGSSITFTKNPDYWGFDEKYPQNRLPYVDEIRGPLIPEPATYLAALRSGKVDYIGNVTAIRSVDQAESLKRTNPEIVQWVSATVSGGTSTGLNVNKPPFDDIRVRQAMQMALDLETINNAYFKGHGDTTPHGQIGDGGTGYFIPFEEWPAELKKVFDYDPEGAKKLLAEASYPKGFKTTYTLLKRYDLNYVELIASYWKKIGVDVEIQVQPIAAFAAIRKDRTFEMISHEAGYGTTSSPLLGPSRFLSTGPYNTAAVEDPDYDALYDAAGSATTIEEQQRLVKEADIYPMERHWFVWGPANPLFNAIQPWVKGYNGETRLTAIDQFQVFARLWIDSALKKEMGY